MDATVGRTNYTMPHHGRRPLRWVAPSRDQMDLTPLDMDFTHHEFPCGPGARPMVVDNRLVNIPTPPHPPAERRFPFGWFYLPSRCWRPPPTPPYAARTFLRIGTAATVAGGLLGRHLPRTAHLHASGTVTSC